MLALALALALARARARALVQVVERDQLGEQVSVRVQVQVRAALQALAAMGGACVAERELEVVDGPVGVLAYGVAHLAVARSPACSPALALALVPVSVFVWAQPH